MPHHEDIIHVRQLLKEALMPHYKKCCGMYDLDDMLQECTLTAMRRLKRYDPSKGSLKTFLYWVAKSSVSDMLEWRGPVRARTKSKRICTMSTSEAALDSHVCEAESPEDQYAAKQQLHQLSLLIDRLPSNEKLIVRRKMEGATLEAISRETGSYTSMVHYNFIQAVRKLKHDRQRQDLPALLQATARGDNGR